MLRCSGFGLCWGKRPFLHKHILHVVQEHFYDSLFVGFKRKRELENLWAYICKRIVRRNECIEILQPCLRQE